MSETTTSAGRDAKSGRFLAGNSGNGGRKPGARGKFSDQFVEALASTFEELGDQAMRRVAIEEPAAFLRVCAMLMPRDVSMTLGIDAASFARTFRDAAALLGNETEAPRQRRLLPNQRVIDHDG